MNYSATQITSCLIAFGAIVSASESNSRVFDGIVTGTNMQNAVYAHPATMHPSSSQVTTALLRLNTQSPVSQIDVALGDPENFEDGELPPSQKAIDDIKGIIDEASLNPCFRMGDIAPYFGEVSVTWRKGGRMLRLTTFSDDRRPRLDFGTTPVGGLGEYEFDPEATAEQLLARLVWLDAPPTIAA